MTWLAVFAVPLAAACLAGTTAAVLGVLAVGLRLPFLAVATTHGALAGAAIATWAGLPRDPAALAGALLAALLLARILNDRNMDHDAALATVFSLSLGVAFLFLGLRHDPAAGDLGLLGGSVLFADRSRLLLLALAAGALGLLLLVADRRLRLLLFSRDLARLSFDERPLLALLLVLAALVVTVELDVVGGLLLHALIVNPAVAAMACARSYGGTLAWAASLGLISALLGFAAAVALDLPVGATIVITATLVSALARWVTALPWTTAPTTR